MKILPPGFTRNSHSGRTPHKVMWIQQSLALPWQTPFLLWFMPTYTNTQTRNVATVIFWLRRITKKRAILQNWIYWHCKNYTRTFAGETCDFPSGTALWHQPLDCEGATWNQLNWWPFICHAHTKRRDQRASPLYKCMAVDLTTFNWPNFCSTWKQAWPHQSSANYEWLHAEKAPSLCDNVDDWSPTAIIL